MNVRRLVGVCLLLVLASASLLMAPARAAGDPAGESGGPQAERLLVVSMPGLTWAEVESQNLPALNGFFAESALADLAPRGVSPRAGPGDAYLTISSGARAATAPSVDGQVLALDEQSSGSAAGEIYSRRTGLIPEGRFVALAWPSLIRVNAARPFDAVLGLLGTTLANEGIMAGVIGNADGTDSIGTSHQRQVGLALADTSGVVADGALEKSILRGDPEAIFGLRFDHESVLQRFDESWGRATPEADETGGVVLVEMSDLARTLRYRPVVGSDRYRELWEGALQDSDALFARLMSRVDPQRDAVLVVAPYNLSDQRDLTAVALRLPGGNPGYLQSASTQRSGFLTLVDIGPTILDVFDVARPVEMEGRPAEVVPSSSSLNARVDRLVSLNDASRFRERLLVPTTVAIVLTMTLVVVGTVVVIAGRRHARWRRWLAFAALTDLAIFPTSYLARAFDLENLGLLFYWSFVLLTSLLLAAAALLISRRTKHPRAALVVVLSVLGGVLVLDVMTGSNLSLSAAFGYSPTGNSRLYGISNYSYGQLSTAACLLAAVLAARSTGLRGRGAAIALLVATLVVLGVPIWGADVGGVIAFTPTIPVFLALVMGRQIRWRTVVAGAVATVAAIAAFGLLDLARPPRQRAHLGRLFERVGNEGLGPLFSIVERKLVANLQVSVSSFWVAAIPVAVMFWIFLKRFPSRPLEPVFAKLPTLRAGLAAAVAAAGLGSIVNDSGAIIGGVAAAVIGASLAYLVVTEPAVENSLEGADDEPELPGEIPGDSEPAEVS